MFNKSKMNKLKSTFGFVFFLFQDKHVVIEKLLQFFIREINAKLIKTIFLENLEPGNVEHPSERAFLLLGVQCVVTPSDQVFEQSVVN